MEQPGEYINGKTEGEYHDVRQSAYENKISIISNEDKNTLPAKPGENHTYEPINHNVRKSKGRCIFITSIIIAIVLTLIVTSAVFLVIIFVFKKEDPSCGKSTTIQEFGF